MRQEEGRQGKALIDLKLASFSRPIHLPVRIAVLAIAALLALFFVSTASAAPPESPSTYFPAAVGATTATLHGVLDETVESFPVEPGAYQFLYKATPEITAAECESAGASQVPAPPEAYAGLEPESVFAEATGLSPNTSYVVCLAAESGGERTVGNPVGFTTLPAAPLTEGPSEVTATSARLEGTLEPPGEELEYEFRYRRGSSCEGGSATSPTSGEGAVSALVSGLAPASRYTFCLLATGPGGAAVGATVSFETSTGPPAVGEEFASKVAVDGAALNATVNPSGLATAYHFEYDTVPYAEGEPAHGTKLPALDASAGAGNEGRVVSVPLQGLAPATTYYYRAVAANALGTVAGEGESFTTPFAAPLLLPDGRGWELVSPPDKHGSTPEAISLEGGVIQAAPEGDDLAYIAKGPVSADPAGNRSFASQQLLAGRGAEGWSTADLAIPHEAVAGLRNGELSEYRLFSPELSRALVQPAGASALSPLASELTPYRREPNGEYLPLVYPGNVPLDTHFGAEEVEGHLAPSTGVQIAGASPDLSHVLLTAHQSLLAGFETGEVSALYEWAGGVLAPVSILPGGASAGTEGGVKKLAEPGQLGSTQLPRDAVSADGSRVFFETATAGHLYLRDVPAGESAQLDAPAAGAEGGAGEAVYQDASRDGGVVYFTDEARLTADSHAAEGRPDLYSCEVAALQGEESCASQGRLTDLTVAAGGEAGGVLGAVAGMSADGRYVYFVADGVLADNAVENGAGAEEAAPGTCRNQEAPQPGLACGLYLYHDGATTFIATLSGEDTPDWGAPNGVTELPGLTARVSPSGRFLAFMSDRPLSGYDNRDVASGRRDEEVYLYDAAARGGQGELRCASCNPTGERPAGTQTPEAVNEPSILVDRPEIWSKRWLAAAIPGWTADAAGHSLYQSRYLSNSGRLFFNAADSLVAQDTNGTFDVYQFEFPQGPGQPESNTCTTSSTTYSPASGGCASLISSGTSAEESAFLDASESGDDVFFLTAAHLSRADFDGALDVYDAHVCSAAMPCPSVPPSATAPCEGEACQPPAPPPSSPAPVTTAAGPGNPRHRHKHHRKTHKKHHRGHGKQGKAAKRPHRHTNANWVVSR